MSLESLVTGFGGLIGKAAENRQNRKAVDAARRQQMAALNALDWEPTYASQTVPQYQKTNSPLARSVIESFLMGNNPDAISPNAPNAAVQKQRLQNQQNAMFGTPEQRLVQQRAAQAFNPYAFKTPTKPVMSQQNQQAAYKIGAPGASEWGIDKDTYDKLVAGGYVGEGQDIRTALDSRVGKENGAKYAAALKNALAAGDSAAVNDLLHPNYEGHGMAQHIRQRRRSKKIGGLIDRYDGED